MTTTVTESQIQDILAHPLDREWSIQGFGMLRTYLDAEHIQRLHIWDPTAAVDEVSTIHDHPWDFTSRIVSGVMHNQRYLLDAETGPEFTTSRLRCGVGGGLVGSPRTTLIRSLATEVYGPEDDYSMEAPEFHESYPSPGAVTVITRSFQEDRDIATVCWQGPTWVSAEPRPATREEIERFVALARSAA